MAVTTCGLPQSHYGAPSYPKDPANPGTMPAYEVTTLAPPAPPPFGWTGKMLRQAQKHNEPISLLRSSGLSKQLAQLDDKPIMENQAKNIER